MNKVHILFPVFLLAACTQQPAPVALKGQDSFTRNGASSKVAAAPVYSSPIIEETQQNAEVRPISVSDLAPPPKKTNENSKRANDKNDKAVVNPEFKQEAKREPKSEQKAEQKVSVSATNPWTNKQRDFSGEQDEDGVKQAMPEVKTEIKPEAESEAKASGKPEAASVVKLEDYKWPVESDKIISSFGAKSGGKVNDGVNIAANNGDSVRAAAAGEVVYVGNNMDGYGNIVIIKHAGEKSTSYAHLSRATVDKYERVQLGDIIGRVGTTGNVKKPQLFFSLRDGNSPIDPAKYISNQVAGL